LSTTYKTFKEVIGRKFLAIEELLLLGIRTVCPTGNQDGMQHSFFVIALNNNNKEGWRPEIFLIQKP